MRVELADDLLEIDVAVAGGAEVPAAPQVAERQVRAEDAGLAVERHGRVLHVDMVDPVGELADEQVRLHALPDEMARIEVEAQRRPAFEFLEKPVAPCRGRRRSRSDGPRGRT